MCLLVGLFTTQPRCCAGSTAGHASCAPVELHRSRGLLYGFHAKPRREDGTGLRSAQRGEAGLPRSAAFRALRSQCHRRFRNAHRCAVWIWSRSRTAALRGGKADSGPRDSPAPARRSPNERIRLQNPPLSANRPQRGSSCGVAPYGPRVSPSRTRSSAQRSVTPPQYPRADGSARPQQTPRSAAEAPPVRPARRPNAFPARPQRNAEHPRRGAAAVAPPTHPGPKAPSRAMKVTRTSPPLRAPLPRAGGRAARPEARPCPAVQRYKGFRSGAASPRRGAEPQPGPRRPLPPPRSPPALTLGAAAAGRQHRGHRHDRRRRRSRSHGRVAGAARRVPAGANQRPRGGRGGRARLRVRIVGKSPAERPRSALRSPARRLRTRLSAPPAQAGRAAASCPVNKGLPPSAASGRRQEAARSREGTGRDGGGARRGGGFHLPGRGAALRAGEAAGGGSGAQRSRERGPVPLRWPPSSRAQPGPGGFCGGTQRLSPFPPLFIAFAAWLCEPLPCVSWQLPVVFSGVCCHPFLRDAELHKLGNEALLILPRSLKSFHRIFAPPSALRSSPLRAPIEPQAAPGPEPRMERSHRSQPLCRLSVWRGAAGRSVAVKGRRSGR